MTSFKKFFKEFVETLFQVLKGYFHRESIHSVKGIFFENKVFPILKIFYSTTLKML